MRGTNGWKAAASFPYMPGGFGCLETVKPAITDGKYGKY
jgi:hypothetical protein